LAGLRTNILIRRRAPRFQEPELETGAPGRGQRKTSRHLSEPVSRTHPAEAALQLLAAGGGFRHGQGGLANPKQIAIFPPFAPAGTFPNKPLVPHFPVLNLA
jgi:hypothetical protein